MVDDKPARNVVATTLWGVFPARIRLLKRRIAPWLQPSGAFSGSKQRARSGASRRAVPPREGGFTLPKQRDSESVRGFTLAELLVTMGVLVLLVLLFTQLLNSAATVTTLGHKQMDVDSQSRQILDRMALDFAQMVKRSDVDYYLKSSQAGMPDCTTCTTQAGNDRIAFFGATPGYYPTSSYQSPLSLIAYRVYPGTEASPYYRLQRLGKGLIWNGGSSSYTPILFLDSATAPTTTIANTWPAAVSNISADSDYELIGPQIFRFEYYYLLKGQVANGTTYNPIFADTPWDMRISGHTNVSGMRDVAAVIMNVASIDPKTKVLLDASGSSIATLAMQLTDWGNASCPGCPSPTQWQTTPGLLRAQWRAAIDANSIGLPPSAISGIRVYERYFYLNQ
jgi:hypothetical protein